MDLVSVIIPTYNGSQYISRALNSVLNQTYKNIEIIIVDDNGRNTEEQLKTQKIIEPFLNDKRVKYVIHEENKNGAAARNTGFRNSNGKYIAFLDDDDEYLPNKIADQVEVISKLDEDWGMVYCASNYRGFEKSGDLLYDLLLHSVVIGSNSLMIKREIFEKLNGFDESFLRHQDYEFTARAAAITNIKCVKSVGYIYNSEVGRNKAKSVEIAQKYRAHYIDKMLPLIKKFSKFRQKVIICSNSMEVVSVYLRKLKLWMFYKELRKFTSQWDINIGIHIILCTLLMKTLRKLNRKPYKNAKEWGKKCYSNH